MTNSYFERAWKLDIATLANQNLSIDSSQNTPLKILFNVETRALSVYWTADITIYNLDKSIASALTQNQWTWNQPLALGDSIIISAGYKNGPSGVFDPNANIIFQGSVYQPYQTRENVVDSVVKLRCVLGLLQDSLNGVNIAVPGGLTQAEIVQSIAKAAGIPVVGNLSGVAALTSAKHPRSQTFTGRPFKFLNGIAQNNNLSFWLSPGGINIRSLDFDQTQPPAYMYGPLGFNYSNVSSATVVKNTLLGVPEQTQQGIIFRVLMDAQPQIGDTVQIPQGVAINFLQFQFGYQLPAIADPHGIFVIAGIKHVGNSRGTGDDWYTEISALSKQFFPPDTVTAPDTN